MTVSIPIPPRPPQCKPNNPYGAPIQIPRPNPSN